MHPPGAEEVGSAANAALAALVGSPYQPMSPLPELPAPSPELGQVHEPHSPAHAPQHSSMPQPSTAMMGGTAPSHLTPQQHHQSPTLGTLPQVASSLPPSTAKHDGGDPHAAESTDRPAASGGAAASMHQQPAPVPLTLPFHEALTFSQQQLAQAGALLGSPASYHTGGGWGQPGCTVHAPA